MEGGRKRAYGASQMRSMERTGMTTVQKVWLTEKIHANVMFPKEDTHNHLNAHSWAILPPSVHTWHDNCFRTVVWQRYVQRSMLPIISSDLRYPTLTQCINVTTFVKCDTFAMVYSIYHNNNVFKNRKNSIKKPFLIKKDSHELLTSNKLKLRPQWKSSTLPGNTSPW